MTNDCSSIDPLVTSYVDEQLAAADREAVDRHLSLCPACKARVTVEQAVRGLVHANKSQLRAQGAPASLHRRCADLARTLAPTGGVLEAHRQTGWTLRAKLVPVALAASLAVLVSGAVLYEATERSATVLAAELAADHVKCFAVNELMGTHESPASVETEMLAGFGWRMQVPAELEGAGLELVGARPCLYAEGKIAHIMYRYQGQPVSVFMLPRTVRHDDLVDVLGHEAAIWSEGDRTFVLLARKSRVEVRRMTSLVKAAFH